MSGPALPTVISALAGALETIQPLRVFDHVPLDTEYPAAFIVPPAVQYQHAHQGGYIRLELDVILLVGSVVERAQRDLWKYLDWQGASSVYLAVRNDKTLGVPGVDANVVSSRTLGEEEMAGYRAFGAAVSLIIGVTNPAQ